MFLTGESETARLNWFASRRISSLASDMLISFDLDGCRVGFVVGGARICEAGGGGGKRFAKEIWRCPGRIEEAWFQACCWDEVRRSPGGTPAGWFGLILVDEPWGEGGGG